MILTAIVIALLLDQIRSVERDHAVTGLLRRWIHAAAEYVDAGERKHAWLAWALAVAVPALAAGLAGWVCARAAGWFGQLVWNVVVLYFTLGFRQFSYRYTAIRDALARSEQAKARDLLAQWQDVEAEPYGQPPRDNTAARASAATQDAAQGVIARGVIGHAVLSAHRCVFGVLFWFCLLALPGLAPAGAVLYRQAELAARYWRHKAYQSDATVSPGLLVVSQTAWAVIDWLPARVTALVFAIVGNFEDAIAAWRQRDADGIGSHSDASADNDAIVLAAAAGALGLRLMDIRAEPGVAPSPADSAAKTAASTTVESCHADLADMHQPPHPPDWEPATPLDDAASASAADACALFGAEPDPRHFAQVAGLLWRSVALWLLLLILLSLAHVLG
ncbi:MAG: cobalamin biosynthesis protein [Burkholderiaceae bacterium]|jgi:adenosylcobinamide-phosphate synthase|nr:cobalamin biosynthesis protein [Burkholderiaceae bacterium]